jgi:hypothetical protein
MTESERALAVAYLEQSRDRVLAFAASLTPEQRDFCPSDSGWSAAGLLEHIIVVERLTHDILNRMISEGVPDESRRGKGAHKDRIILENIPMRATRVQAPQSLHPSGRWGDFEQLVREFELTRNRTLEIARTTDKDLRVYFAPHPFLKDLDGYQWLLIVGAHAERHVRQAEEMLAAERAAHTA